MSSDLQEAVTTNTSDISALKTSVATAKTEVAAGDYVSVSKSQGSAGQDVYTVSTDVNTATYISTGAAVKGQFTASRTDSTASLYDAAGTRIGYLVPDLGKSGQVLTSTGTATTWTNAGGSGSSNILVVQYGSRSSLSDMMQYDTVLMQMNNKTFYMTEVNASYATFVSSYLINASWEIETCEYYGDDAWDKVHILSLNKVAASAEQNPDYLGNVLKAGDGVSIAVDGAQVTISSSGSSGIEVIETADSDVTALDSIWHKLTNAGNVTVTLDTSVTNYGFQYTSSALSKVTIATDLTHWHIVGCKDRGNGTIPVYVPAGKSIVCRIWQDFIFIALATGTDTDTNDSNSIFDTLTLFDSGTSRLGSMEQDQASAVVNLMSSLIDTIGSMQSEATTACITFEASSITEVTE